MPDFEANEDHVRLSDSAGEDPYELPLLRPRFLVRGREMGRAQCFGSRGPAPARVSPRLGTARWRAGSRACRSARSAGLLAAMPSRRRRLWTKCHGRVPGPPS